jgi:hypothetical protein
MPAATLTLYLRVPTLVWPVIGCSLVFAALLLGFWRSHAGVRSFYLDPQDFRAYENGGGRELPLAAANSTFEPLLRNYIDVTKLLITVAAASIAFGGSKNPTSGVSIAKVTLAFSILYGVMFCALLQFFYDEYTQNVRAYTRLRYSLIEALGFSTLSCFIAGYFFWAFNLM